MTTNLRTVTLPSNTVGMDLAESLATFARVEAEILAEVSCQINASESVAEPTFTAAELAWFTRPVTL